MNCETARFIFTESYYRDLDPLQQQNLEQHFKSCAACASEFERLTSVLDLMKKRKQEDPGEDFWSGYYDRLQSRMNVGARLTTPGRNKLRPYVWIAQIAAALILVGVGIIIGKYYLNQNVENILTKKTNIPGPTLNDAHVEKAQAFLQRSQILLLGFVNADTKDLSKERQVSRDLIQEASTLKNDLNNPRDRRLRALVSELEVILLEIADLDKQGDLQGVDMIRSGVDRKGVLLKINLEQMRLSDQAVKTEEKHPGSKL
jgi:hypothetical protein